MTRRQAILAAIIADLGAISVANGYLTNLGPNVTHWVTRPIAAGTTTRCCVKDTDNIHNVGDGDEETLILEINIAYKDDAKSEATIYTGITNMVQDVLKNFEANESNLRSSFGYMVYQPEVESIELMLEDEHMAEATIIMNCTHTVNEKWTLDKTVYS